MLPLVFRCNTHTPGMLQQWYVLELVIFHSACLALLRETVLDVEGGDSFCTQLCVVSVLLCCVCSKKVLFLFMGFSIPCVAMCESACVCICLFGCLSQTLYDL